MTHVASKQPPKPVGEVIRYFPKDRIALIRFHKDIPMYSHIIIRGEHAEVDEVITSMEFEHVPIWIAEKETEIGVAVRDPVRSGDRVYEV